MGNAFEILREIEEFLASTRQPALLEEGEAPIVLLPDSYSLGCRGGLVTLAAWDREHNLVRRVAAIEDRRPGRLLLLIERFGRRRGQLVLYDQKRAVGASAKRRGARIVGRELLRRFLRRQFPGWRIASLSGDPDLEHSLSPSYPRALVRKGSQGWAAIAALEAGSADGLLTFGLIWLDHLRRTHERVHVAGLALLLPEGSERVTCLRIRWLNPGAVSSLLFVRTPDGHERQVDPRDHGNLETRLETFRNPLGAGLDPHPLLDAVRGLAGVDAVSTPDGAISLRVRGLEFARASGTSLAFGIREKRPANAASLPEIRSLTAELGRLRSARSSDRGSPLYSCLPEAWIESQVRAHLQNLDAALRGHPLYGQVPAFACGDRGILDLLAADLHGRLTVIELKAAADPHLPLQALDYWMRVKWHLDRGDFSRLGYFPGVALAARPPRLLLVAPALEFHPTSETILRFLSPEIPVERIGIGANWRSELRVVFRAAGARRPGIA